MCMRVDKTLSPPRATHPYIYTLAHVCKTSLSRSLSLSRTLARALSLSGIDQRCIDRPGTAAAQFRVRDRTGTTRPTPQHTSLS